MTSPSDRLADALAVWPLDREQVSFLHKSIAEIDEAQAEELLVLLREAEQAVLSCASVLAKQTPVKSVSRVPAPTPSLPTRSMSAHPTPGRVMPHSPASDQLIEVLKNTIVALVRRDGPDLSARQLGVFLTCYLQAEAQTVRGLAAELDVSKPVISRALDRLGELNLARRKVDPLDRRSVLVQRTAAGMAFLRDLRSIFAPMRKERMPTREIASV